MIWQSDLILLTLIVLCALVSLRLRDLMASAMVFGAYSFLMCLIWAGMGAVDVAFTEAAVGAGVGTVFIVALIYNTSRSLDTRPRDIGFKLFAGIVVIVVGSFLMSAVPDLPDWGDPYAPANSHVSAYYIKNSIKDTHVPNVVTTTLADYRGFDTMFETGVVFIALMGIFNLLSRFVHQKRLKEVLLPSHQKVDSVVIQYATKMLVPVMQLFSFYVIAHGHYSPGGGFQGGVILGASIILYSMAFDMNEALKRLSVKWTLVLGAVGVLIFSGIGALCVALGGNFLDYSVLATILPGTDSVMARSHAMLGVEVGVGFTVMCGMFGIYGAIASNGEMKSGL